MNDQDLHRSSEEGDLVPTTPNEEVAFGILRREGAVKIHYILTKEERFSKEVDQRLVWEDNGPLKVGDPLLFVFSVYTNRSGSRIMTGFHIRRTI